MTDPVSFKTAANQAAAHSAPPPPGENDSNGRSAHSMDQQHVGGGATDTKIETVALILPPRRPSCDTRHSGTDQRTTCMANRVPNEDRACPRAKLDEDDQHVVIGPSTL